MARPKIILDLVLAVFIIIPELHASTYSRSLTEVLKNYETLKKEHIQHSIGKRSVNFLGNKKLHFQSFGRNFDLKLVSDSSIFSPQFEAIVVNDKEERQFQIEKDNFFKGYVDGEFDSRVQAHLEDGVLTASIKTDDEVFVVEPSSRHVDGDHDFDMIVYKLSDVQSNFTKTQSGHPSFCGVKEHNTEHVEFESQDASDKSHEKSANRQRRAAGTIETYDTCQLALVADHLFVKHMGQGKTSTAISYMLSVLQRVDQIYRSTNWFSGLKNIGLEVRKVIVHETASGPSGPEYNQFKSKPWKDSELLTAFSKGSWSDVCLAHLFTYQDFPEGVMGVAYVGNPKPTEEIGICSHPYKNSEQVLTHLNSGLSTSYNWGRRILTSEADVVTSHGHNFGSSHDPSTTGTCSPSDLDGGKYMMYPTSVSGLKPNNQKFSPCSKRSIEEVLNVKRTRCFKSKIGQYCGNFEVEKNLKDPSKSETCDPGIDAINNGTDKCCDVNCKLKPGAVCSDANTPCCDNCQLSSKTKKCRNRFALACQGETYCNGLSDTCPEPPPLTGVPCSFSKGVCMNGKCLTFCQQHKMVDCVCSKSDTVCKICCKKANSTDTTCSPIIVNSTSYIVNDGKPCRTAKTSGSCAKGKCEKLQKNVFDHLYDLMKHFTAKNFARFMQENIVGTILVFSLFLWIPSSCIVHFVDKRREKEANERREWESHDNTNLIWHHTPSKQKEVFKHTPRKNVTTPQRNIRA
eukprot:gene12069-13313_t